MKLHYSSFVFGILASILFFLVPILISGQLFIIGYNILPLSFLNVGAAMFFLGLIDALLIGLIVAFVVFLWKRSPVAPFVDILFGALAGSVTTFLLLFLILWQLFSSTFRPDIG